jgi:hypothetical protein
MNKINAILLTLALLYVVLLGPVLFTWAIIYKHTRHKLSADIIEAVFYPHFYYCAYNSEWYWNYLAWYLKAGGYKDVYSHAQFVMNYNNSKTK